MRKNKDDDDEKKKQEKEELNSFFFFFCFLCFFFFFSFGFANRSRIQSRCHLKFRGASTREMGRKGGCD